MESNLRPLTLGEILDRTAQLYRDNFLLFAGIAAVYAGVSMVFNLLGIGLEEILRLGHQETQLRWVVLLFNGVILLIIVLIGSVEVAASTRAVAWVNLGEPATISGAYRSIFSRFGRYLWLGILKTFLAWWPLIILYAGMISVFVIFVVKNAAGIGSAAVPASGQVDSSMILFGILLILVFLLMIPALVFGILFALRYSLAIPACVVENLTARLAIRRSIALTKGAKGSIFVLWLLVAFILLALGILTQGFFIVYAFKHHQQVPAGLKVLQQVISFFTGSFITPILSIGITLFYYDQRIRMEGYDIEWMMQAAGLTVPVAAVEPAAIEPALAPSEPEAAHE